MRRGTAKVSDKDCILLLPADTPYDIQALVDEVDWRATRRGPIRVELNRSVWLVDATRAQSRACAVCKRPIRIEYVTGSRSAVCGACAGSEFAAARAWRSPSRKAASS